MATRWNDLKHKASPEEREQLKQEAVAELNTQERYAWSCLHVGSEKLNGYAP